MTTKVTVIPSTIDPLTQLPRNSKEKIKVAAYARVSTNSEEQNTSYEAQYQDLNLCGLLMALDGTLPEET
jgi:hypothetical protein